jgi:hypothetical protein
VKRAARNLLLLMLAGAVLVALAIAAVLVWGIPYEHITVVIDGKRIELPPLGPSHWLVASVVVLLVLAVLAVVVPLAIAFGLAAPLGLLALALIAFAVLAAVALSPVLLLGWLMWRIGRRPGTGTPPAPHTAP